MRCSFGAMTPNEIELAIRRLIATKATLETCFVFQMFFQDVNISRVKLRPCMMLERKSCVEQFMSEKIIYPP